MQRFALIIVCMTLFWSDYGIAQGIIVSTHDGGTVSTELGYGIKVNKNSTLRRTWVVLNDPTCPVQLTAAGVATQYGDRQYKYVPTGTAKASEAISAVEVRYLLYDVFGDHLRTLSGMEITDLAANTPLQLKDTGSWRAWENDVSQLLTVVAFVAKVRTANGRIWRYQDKAIGEELSKIRLKVTSGVLEPSKEK